MRRKREQDRERKNEEERERERERERARRTVYHNMYFSIRYRKVCDRWNCLDGVERMQGISSSQQDLHENRFQNACKTGTYFRWNFLFNIS